MENELLKSVVQESGILRKIYGDLAKPGVKQVGKALGTLLGLGNTALWPVALLNERAKIALESNLEKYREIMKNTSEEEVCAVVPEVGVPIMEKLSYVTNEEISEMYIELLLNASRKKSVNLAHPGFVNIINSISPDEAILLRSVRRVDGIPFVQVRLQKKGETKWFTLHPMVLQSEYLSELNFPDNLSAYISNLEGLGIFNVRDDIYMDIGGVYEELEKIGKDYYLNVFEQMSDRKVTVNRGKIEVTPFARLFFECMPLHVR